MLKISPMLAAAALALAATPAPAQDYPNAPVHLISGFPAGSTADISARVVGAKMGADPRPAVRDREPARRRVQHRRRAGRARRRRTATRCYVSSAANMINAAMSTTLNFDIIKDFAPIALLTSTPTVLVVTPELGVKSVKELTALAKQKPDTLVVRLLRGRQLDASRA